MAKYKGYKAVLKRNTTGTTYATVGQVLEIGEVGSTRALIDVTAHGDEWMDWLTGRQDGTEVTVNVALDPVDAQHLALKTDYDAGTQKKFRMEHPDFPTRGLEFTTVITSYRERAEQGGAYQALITLKIVNPGVAVVTI